jgi:hypothetical protein
MLLEVVSNMPLIRFNQSSSLCQSLLMPYSVSAVLKSPIKRRIIPRSQTLQLTKY